MARDNPRGDLILDLKNDHQLPDIVSWRQFKNYLEARSACDGAIGAAHAFWYEYERYQRHYARSVSV